MQLKGSSIEAFLKAPGNACEIILLHGRDAGLVRERAKALQATILGPAPDPFSLVELGESVLKDAPGALYAEAAAIAMLGGRKFIRVRMAPETAGTALEAYVAERQAGAVRPGALIVVEAGELKPTQKLRKLAEASPLAAAIACYPDDDEGLDAFIGKLSGSAGARITPEARRLLMERLGSDRGVSRQEIDKLFLYAGVGLIPEVTIEAADVDAVIGDSAAAELDRLIDAVLSGDLVRTARLIERLRQAAPPVRMLRALSTQLDRMAVAQGGAGARGNYYQSQALARHLARWSPRMIERAQALVLETEIGCKSTGSPDEALLERALLSLARGARDTPLH
jgi:DNA polymerase-3 subunit delta